MHITEVRLKPMSPRSGDYRLLAFVSITLDDSLIIQNLKLIHCGERRFVSMPSRDVTDRCPRADCGWKNSFRAAFCGHCGSPLERTILPRDHHGRTQLYREVVFPITTAFRKYLEQTIETAYLLATSEHHPGVVVIRVEENGTMRIGEFKTLEDDRGAQVWGL
jgi:DNA-binding cell septation regulator SpoVG